MNHAKNLAAPPFNPLQAFRFILGLSILYSGSLLALAHLFHAL